MTPFGAPLYTYVKYITTVLLRIQLISMPTNTQTETYRVESGGTSKWQKMLNKVPEITLYFWIIKVLCTTVGETAADFLNVNQELP